MHQLKMHPYQQLLLTLCPGLSHATIIFLVALFHGLVSSMHAYDYRYETCSRSFICGNLGNLGYPFWGGNRPQFCGHPGFEIDCSDGEYALIKITSLTYAVRRIDTTAQTMIVAREDLQYGFSVCSTESLNTTIDPNLFSYVTSSESTSLYVYYNCSSNFSHPLPNSFDCGEGTENATNFFTTDTKLAPRPLCNSMITVPVDGGIAQVIRNATRATTNDLKDALSGGFPLRWMANNTSCDFCFASGGRCGSIPNSTAFACYCPDTPRAFSCNDDQTGSGHPGRIKLAIGLSVSLGLAGIVTLSAATIYIYTNLKTYRKQDKGKNQKVEATFKNFGSLAPKLYSYSEIKKITNSFTDKLGQGGYGSVYKGKLSDGSLVAVKVLSDAKGNGEEFINEVASISRTSHVNIVTLMGFCYKDDKKALIYEFMSNGSLDKYIYEKGSSHPNRLLDWNTSYKIAVGVARGLEYLHRGCNTRIVHFDIKPHNILLSKDFSPKISDFGLAKLGERTQSIISMLDARGTPGYIAPEVFCRSFGGVSHKSDVYSYGMLVLEMVGLRRKANEAGSEQTSEKYFPDYIYDNLELGKDLELQGVMSTDDEEIARKMILVGLWCIQTNPTDRPRMSKVVEMLEGGLQSLQIPPKPFLYSPPAKESAKESLTSSSHSFGETEGG